MYSPKIPKPTVLSVSQLNYYIKSVLENDPRLNVVFLAGEISNLTDHYRSGHIYLSLKDERSVLRAVMFAGNAGRLRFRPQNGMRVLCRGRISLYEPSGQYQLYIEDMQPDGVGALALAFDQLKQRLESQGLFAREHKKPLPRFPKTVGVITSPTGAAVQDIRNILYRRYPCVDMLLFPVLVQGEGAPKQLTDALRKLDSSGVCDVIIIGRGGGSAEDLWAFNDEGLAREIYNCRTPVISAVGHETDFTICDFVADMRAPTQSAAAELAVPDIAELRTHYRSQLQYLEHLINNRMRSADNTLLRFLGRMAASGPEMRSQRLRQHYQLTAKRLESGLRQRLSESELMLRRNAAKLESLNPISVLGRGYTITEQNGSIIPLVSQLDRDKPFTVIFSDGRVEAECTEKNAEAPQNTE